MSPRDYGKEIDQLGRDIKEVERLITNTASELRREFNASFDGVNAHLGRLVPSAVDTAFAPIRDNIKTISEQLAKILQSNAHQTTLLEARKQVQEESKQTRALVVAEHLETLEVLQGIAEIDRTKADTDAKGATVIDARISGSRSRRIALAAVGVPATVTLLIFILSAIFSHR